MRTEQRQRRSQLTSDGGHSVAPFFGNPIDDGPLAAFMPSATYRHELAVARRDAAELNKLLARAEDDPTIRELMAAIGLATMARAALLRAAKAREADLKGREGVGTLERSRTEAR
jgi:hypothetical protein